MAKYLINDKEAAALRTLVKWPKLDESLKYDSKKKVIANFPFRFKTKEAMVASTATTNLTFQANADIYFLGGSTNLLVDTDYVVDDSSAFKGMPVNTIGTCIASSAYHIINILSAQSYMGLAISDYAEDSTNVTIDGLEALDGVATTLLELTARNRFHWAVTEDKWCWIKWNIHTSGYDLIQTECP